MKYNHEFDDSSATNAETSNEPEYLNDAEVLGVETDAYIALLSQPATLMTGALWGARNHRNTQDNGWMPVTMPWASWIDGGPAVQKKAPWGFSRHHQDKNKAGECIVLGSSIGKARKAKAMDTMYAIGIDIDAGFPLDAMLDKLKDLGLFCLVYTSHSHGKSGLQLKHDEVIRKLKIKPAELNKAQVQRYLREFDKNRYEEEFISKIEIANAKKQVKEGVVIELTTPPLDKYRLIFPLAEPVKLIDLAGTQTAALEVWENKITGLAIETLGVHFDTSCTDPSRLFFTARHPAGAEWYCAVVQGDPLNFADVPSVKKSSYTNTRKAMNAFEVTGGAHDDADRPPRCRTPSGASLNAWHYKAKERFQMANLVEDFCSERIRNVGGEAQGHIHIECPFEYEHSAEGGTGTMVINALDSQNGYWTWFCHHDACQGRHKLEFLQEALRHGWFEESQLLGDSVYMLEGADDDAVIEGLSDEVDAEAVRDDLLSQVDVFDADTTEQEIRALIREALAAGADKTVIGRLKTAIVSKTPLGAKAYNDLFKDEVRLSKKKKSPAKKPSDGIPICLVTTDFHDQLDYTRRQIVAANELCPRLFQFGGAYATADAGRHRIRLIEGRDPMNYILQSITRWEVTKKMGDEYLTLLVAPPEHVVRVLYLDHDFAETLPELLAVPSTPFFDADGKLVEDDGYHAGAKVFLAKGDLALSGVSRTPSSDELAEAKRLIVEEVLADFPLGGMDRAQIVETLSNPNIENTHAVTHAVAFTMLPFCRAMIAGPTPGHAYTKPGPGTGASLLVDILTTIATGAPSPAMELPGRPEEISKTLSATLASGAPVILFDNVGQSIASSALAMAMTGTTYQARILGKSQLVSVPVRCVWAFTANNIEASKEILRRFVLIPLDAGVPDPEKRKPEKGWRHPNINRWVLDNRPNLVWACLTIIQNWVAQGMVPAASPTLASYEDWAAVMGGILNAAGFRGFLEGQEEERAKATDSMDDGIAQLVRILGEYPDQTVFRSGGAREFEGRPTISVLEILNGQERPDVKTTAKEDPIQINGWGYSAHDGAYNNSGRIGRGMKVLARKPYEIAGQLLTFTELTDTKGGVSVYRLNKAAQNGKR